ncbi:MAG: phosphoadenosine phosphosulfate reductase family protein, partial [Dolichospermum sp.]
QLETATPKEILAWSIKNIPTGLVQTSAFNVDDIILTHILYTELEHPVPVIFLDTLYHFPQTLELVAKVKEIYNLDLKTYKTPDVDRREAFAAKFGQALWDTNIAKFHDITKIDPVQRGLDELKTVAWITGRRRDQAVTRATMPALELDGKG